MAYPTPPPTMSPKHSSYPYNAPSQRYPTNDTTQIQAQTQPYQQPYQQPYDASAQPIQAQDPSSFQTPQLSYDPPRKTPAQESYFHSYSAPTSPAPQQQAPYTKPNASPPPQSGVPHRRRSSPIPSPYTHPSSSSPLIHPASPLHRDRSPGNPNYYTNSPLPFSLSPKPGMTPYNLNRPQKRPGFWKRILNKIESWIKSFVRWTKRNPIKMGLLTFLPVMTIAAIAKVVRGIGKGLGLVEKGHGRPKASRGGSSRNVEGEGKRNVRWTEEDEDRGGGWGLDNFKGFGGSKGGPVEGVLKIAQMLV